MYYLAVNRAEELAAFRPVKAVELAFLKDNKGGRIARAQLGLTSKAQQEYSTATEEHLRHLVGRLRHTEATQTFRPNPAANCRFCDFKVLCPLWPEGRELFPEAGARPA